MSKIRAFVGHSFTLEDADTVRRLTDFFDNLARVQPAFTWDHAELAEPRSISEKVLNLTADKNVFIGIYTKKELVLKKPLQSLDWIARLRLTETAFEWKT